MMLWDSFKSRFVITANLMAVTGLRIGAGGTESAQPAASDLPVLVGADDRPFIPGSSLRGVLRSQLERIMRTLEPISDRQKYNGRGACNPVVRTEWCITSDQMRDIRDNVPETMPDKWLAEQVWEQSCRICRTFGSPWLASRVRIADLHLIDDKSFHLQRRDGVAIHREKETVENKYDFEVLSAGTTFQMHITAENLSPTEFGLLWLGVQELKEGHILVGGFKARGLGRVKLDKLKICGIEQGNNAALRRYLVQRELDEISQEKATNWLDQLLQDMGVE